MQRHDRFGIPLGQIAVIVRNGTLAQRTARVLQAQSIPVRQQMSEVILHEEAAVQPLLEVLHWATSSAVRLRGEQAEEAALEMDLPQVLDLLTSRYGAADSLTLRRIRQVLLRAERHLRLEPEKKDHSLLG